MLQRPYIMLLWFLFLLFVKTNCQMTPFKPDARYGHTATLIDNKLCILGGKNTNYSNLDEFFYLDLSFSFNNQSLSWNSIPATIPKHAYAAAAKAGANSNTLFLYGGDTADSGMALVYTFDPQRNSWSTPNIAGNAPDRKYGSIAVVDGSGRMFIWSGMKVVNFNYSIANDFPILDTVKLSWGYGSLNGAPLGRQFYGATLLPGNKIIYIGGRGDFGAFPLSQVYIYDITKDSWSTETTSGTTPSDRDSHSAVLGLDGKRVIIFGGVSKTVSSPVNSTFYAPNDSLYELSLTNYEWSIPKTSGKTPASRYLHKASVVGKYMVVSFGEGYTQSTESDILLLDISNVDEYVWTNNFLPSTSSNRLVIICVTIGSLLIGVLFIFGFIYSYKWCKERRQQKKFVTIPE